MHINAVGRSLPEHYYDQETLLAVLKRQWGPRVRNLARLEQLHRNVLVGGRHLALPLERYQQLGSFTETNSAFIECATELGQRAILDGLSRAGVTEQEIDHLFFVTVTGIATPSIDARLVNRLGLKQTIKRTPIFGLGCAAGAAGLSRAFDYLVAYPEHVAVLLSVELCSLTVQLQDVSVANMISSGLFGDGAAAVVMSGGNRQEPGQSPSCRGQGPRILATRSVFYPDSERVMGWQIGCDGFKIVLSAEVPKMVERHVRADVDQFLGEHGLALSDIGSFVCHPGGPKVIDAMERALGLEAGGLRVTRDSLAKLGNLSSASVLMILGDTMADFRPSAGTLGLLLAMGPGFCSELVLLRW